MFINRGLALGQGVAGSATSRFPRNFINIIKDLNLTENLKVCLDPGDINSVGAGTDQKWLDTSGNGYDFFRGSTAGAEAFDATFNGTAGGLSGSEYWSFDGGDVFVYDSTSETWMDNMHKDGAIFTFLCWVQFGALGTYCNLMATCNTAGTGVQIGKQASNTMLLSVFDAGGVATQDAAGVIGTVAEDTWLYVGFSITEGIEINWQVNSLVESVSGGTSIYATPSSGAASVPMRLGADNSTSYLPNTSRMGMVGMWEGRCFTPAELDAVFQATRGRYGV